ncbi:4-hydroxythreonine-4-phosphate dehydrogenase PdxA [Alphaproteobacteria bacterium KMM 3653]|uniref:4-hydroxythreonine-4-phosphate dehydrogenase n=1 Tax=Harenicola maris TaxID=2841044 RepID=A0AAP2G391_9RHOB|nr:4-hydroxythreonine-4-phosphate dehydrogenase PdxA [Harenicola maris]
MARPPVAVTCGEPAGIGPEIAVKAWEVLGTDLPFVWIGDYHHLPKGTSVIPLDHAQDAAAASKHGLPVLYSQFEGERTYGVANPAHAAEVIDAIDRAVWLCKVGAASSIVTGPINKKALKDGADFAHPGHTEFLAELGGVEDVVMMLAGPNLRVVPATIHIALAEVPHALTSEGLETCLRITHAGLRSDFGIEAPRIAVAGLNPHAGEGGTMGLEDGALIAPVVDKLRAEGWEISGPLPADTMFHEAARAGYDAAVCMYHDQALIPIKTLDFDRGVNVTLGLPFVRTSPDHGTAFDIAGKGIADPTSMIEAIKLADQMARMREAALA